MTDIEPIVITLPFPPSVNHYWKHIFKGRNAGRVYVAEAGVKFREAVDTIVLLRKLQGRGGTGLLDVEIEAFMPDKRNRDLDNLLKASLDALTNAKLWADDSQVDRLSIHRARKIDGSIWVAGMIKVTISPRKYEDLSYGGDGVRRSSAD